MRLILVVMTLLFAGVSYAQSCRQERTIGADWNQARYNCEVILKGDANNCQPYGRMWGCSCSVCPNGGSSSGRFTRTTGTDWGQARYNCEMVLRGTASNCQPSTNGLWYCTCHY